jgi:hypothetical protein
VATIEHLLVMIVLKERMLTCAMEIVSGLMGGVAKYQIKSSTQRPKFNKHWQLALAAAGISEQESVMEGDVFLPLQKLFCNQMLRK